MRSEAPWNSATYDLSGGAVLGREPLRWLGTGRIAVVCLRELLAEQEMDTARRQAHALLGPTPAARAQGPHEYADTGARMARAGFDLPARVRAALRRTFGLSALETASEAVVRLRTGGVRDPLRHDATGTGLLRCVVSLQECDWGGELVVYRRPWEASDERWRVPDGPGYRGEVVAAAPRHVFRPRARDVYLINPAYYHETERAHGAARTTLDLSIGFTDDALV